VTGNRGTAAKFLSVYSSVLLSLAATTMGLIVAVMAVQVFYRYVLNDSLIWAEEVCRYLLMVMTFLLLGPAFERGDMVAVQFLMNAFPLRVARAIMVPMYLLMIGFLLVISYYAAVYAAFNGRFGMPSIDFILTSLLKRPVSNAMSMYWIYMLIPAGCIMLALHLLGAMVRNVRALLDAGKPA
jgi:TRAP-type C4-dicarboxylate transport system permease small subunit